MTVTLPQLVALVSAYAAPNPILYVVATGNVVDLLVYTVSGGELHCNFATPRPTVAQFLAAFPGAIQVNAIA